MAGVINTNDERKESTLILGGNAPEQCTVCGRDGWAFVREGYDKHRPANGKTFRLARCLSCGHIMQNPLPSAEELGEAYAVEYAPYRPAWKEVGWPLWRILRELTTFRRARRLMRYANGSRLLEVGCGAGDFLAAAHRAGWSVAAVEYNKELVEMLRSELSLDVQAGELKPGMWEAGSFDLVVLWSVIEHVPDPNETLGTVASYLKSGGTVFFQLPTTSEAQFGKLFKQHWEMDLPRHLNFFDRRSLAVLCDRAGMELTVYRTSLLETGWCYLTSCLNYANASKGNAGRLVKVGLLIPIMFLLLPYMAIQSWRRRGTEAFAVAVKK